MTSTMKFSLAHLHGVAAKAGVPEAVGARITLVPSVAKKAVLPDGTVPLPASWIVSESDGWPFEAEVVNLSIELGVRAGYNVAVTPLAKDRRELANATIIGWLACPEAETDEAVELLGSVLPIPATTPSTPIVRGQRGVDGHIGPEGPEGPQGPAGQRGEKGDKGDPGPPAVTVQPSPEYADALRISYPSYLSPAPFTVRLPIGALL